MSQPTGTPGRYGRTTACVCCSFSIRHLGALYKPVTRPCAACRTRCASVRPSIATRLISSMNGRAGNPSSNQAIARSAQWEVGVERASRIMPERGTSSASGYRVWRSLSSSRATAQGRSSSGRSPRGSSSTSTAGRPARPTTHDLRDTPSQVPESDTSRTGVQDSSRCTLKVCRRSAPVAGSPRHPPRRSGNRERARRLGRRRVTRRARVPPRRSCRFGTSEERHVSRGCPGAGGSRLSASLEGTEARA